MFTSAWNNRYDTVLINMQTPVIEGLTAAETIRSQKLPYAKTVPIIAVTANAYSEDVKKRKDSGMDGHISKPLNVDKIVRMIVELKNR